MASSAAISASSSCCADKYAASSSPSASTRSSNKAFCSSMADETWPMAAPSTSKRTGASCTNKAMSASEGPRVGMSLPAEAVARSPPSMAAGGACGAPGAQPPVAGVPDDPVAPKESPGLAMVMADVWACWAAACCTANGRRDCTSLARASRFAANCPTRRCKASAASSADASRGREATSTAGGGALSFGGGEPEAAAACIWRTYCGSASPGGLYVEVT